MAQQQGRAGVNQPQPQQKQPESQLQPQSTLQPAQVEPQNTTKPVQIPGAGEVTGVSISKTPRPLNGQELAAVIVYKLAEQIARDFANNGRMSEISAFGRHKIRLQFVAEVVDPTDLGDRIVLQASRDLALDLSAANVDYLRAEAGIGLWHEGRSVNTGSVVEFRQQPSKLVLEHLRNIGPELVKNTNADLNGLDLQLSGLR